MELTTYRLNHRLSFMKENFNVTEIKEVTSKYIKEYTHFCQKCGIENAIIINGSIATLRVFFNGLVDGEYSNVRDELILIMLFDTDIRVSEHCEIKVSDVLFKHITINGKGSKQRQLYISKICEGMRC